MRFKAILFDFIGTTVLEKNEAISSSFEKAFLDNHILFDTRIIQENRGRDKKEIIDLVLNDRADHQRIAPGIYKSFKANIEAVMDSFVLNDHVDEVLKELVGNKIKLGLGSGLPRDLFEKILSHLSLDTGLFSYIGIASEIGKSRPDPAMIKDMMNKVHVSPSAFLKVGDTVSDIKEGKNAGVATVAILSGTQPVELLRDAHADFYISSLTELKEIAKGSRAV